MKNKVLFAFLACGLIFTTACGKKEENKGNNGSNENPPVVEEQGPIANTENAVISDVTIDGLKITNVSVITEGTGSRFNADVVNTNAEAVDVMSFNIIFKDETGNEITTLLGYIGERMEPGKIQPMSAGALTDLTKAKSVEYVRNY